MLSLIFLPQFPFLCFLQIITATSEDRSLFIRHLQPRTPNQTTAQPLTHLRCCRSHRGWFPNTHHQRPVEPVESVHQPILSHGLSSAAAVAGNRGLMRFYSHTPTISPFIWELLFPHRSFTVGTVGCEDPWFHSPVLKVGITATNQPLSSFLSLLQMNFKKYFKKWGKRGQTYWSPAGFSGTKDLLLYITCLKGNGVKKMSQSMNTTTRTDAANTESEWRRAFALFLSTFQNGTVETFYSSHFLLMSLRFLNADSSFFLPPTSVLPTVLNLPCL